MISLKENKRIFPLVGAIIVFVLSFSVLYLGNNIGLSDNGDFRRVLLVNNMESVSYTHLTLPTKA